MDESKRNWLCFICGILSISIGLLGLVEFCYLFKYILGLDESYIEFKLIPYIYVPAQFHHQLIISIISFILLAFAALFFIPWSLKLFNKAKLYSVRVKELNLSDIPLEFPYVLYLRSFDPKSNIANLKDASQIEEENIVHSLSPIGKTVAIGCPGNSIPPLGEYRLNVSDDEWQNTVMQLSKDAELTAIRIVDTEHLGWDIEYVLRNIPDLQKLIFLIPDIEKTNLSFFGNLEKEIREKRPNDVQITPCYFNKQGWGTVSSIIYFEKHEKDSDNIPAYYNMKQSRVPRRRIWNCFGNLSSAFQKTMFPVYKQFGKLSFNKKICNFLSTYNFYILTAIIICSFYLNRHLNLEQWLPVQDQPFTTTSADYNQAIHEAEQRYPKLANNLAQSNHQFQIEYMLSQGCLGSIYLNDEHLLELIPVINQVSKLYHFDNYAIDRILAQYPDYNVKVSREDALIFNNYMLKSALIALKLEEPEYTPITSPDEFQKKLLEERSSFTEEQYETINKKLSPDIKDTPELYFEYMDYINNNNFPDNLKAFLFRGYFIMKSSE